MTAPPPERASRPAGDERLDGTRPRRRDPRPDLPDRDRRRLPRVQGRLRTRPPHVGRRGDRAHRPRAAPAGHRRAGARGRPQGRRRRRAPAHRVLARRRGRVPRLRGAARRVRPRRVRLHRPRLHRRSAARRASSSASGTSATPSSARRRASSRSSTTSGTLLGVNRALEHAAGIPEASWIGAPVLGALHRQRGRPSRPGGLRATPERRPAAASSSTSTSRPTASGSSSTGRRPSCTTPTTGCATSSAGST